MESETIDKFFAGFPHPPEITICYHHLNNDVTFQQYLRQKKGSTLETCRRCEVGYVRVIGAGFQGHTIIVSCDNPNCNAVYEIDLHSGVVSRADGTEMEVVEHENNLGF